MPFVHILVTLLILGVVLYVVSQVPMPAWVMNIINALVVLFTVIWILQITGLIHGVFLR